MSKLTLVFPLAAIAFILLVFSEYLPAAAKPLRFDADSRAMTGRDRLLCLLITLLYAAVAFFNLGDRSGVTSFRRFTSDGETAQIDFPEDVYIGAVRYYSGPFMGQYELSFSTDGYTFVKVSTLKLGHADVFKWRRAELSESWGEPVRALRLTAGKELWMGELALYDDDGRLVPLSDMRIPAENAALFDEQERIPEEDGFRNSTYFDEIYHARTAYEHLENIKPYEISHPPLGKLLLSLGVRIFGMTPFGWRFSGTLFGVLMLPALYLFLKKLFGGTLVPGCCTAVFAADFMHFAQSRLATIDVYEVFFIILMYGFFWGYLRADRERLRAWLPPLALSGVCFGLGAASKWTGFYAGGGLAVLWLLDRVARGVRLCREGRAKQFRRETLALVLWSLLFFVLVPACIYYLSYWRYGTAEGLSAPGMLFTRRYLELVWRNQLYMFRYHSGVTATHPYSSVWWQWILDIRPILYYLRNYADGTQSSIGAWLNPILCWGGLLAMLAMLYRAVFRRDETARFILIGYLAQLLPWVFVTRVVFEYHYFPSSVFLVLALGHVFRTMELHRPETRRSVLSFALVAVVVFAAFYPVLSALRVPRWYDLRFLKWLPTWPM